MAVGHRARQRLAARRGQLPAVTRAHRRACHDASVRACDEELSTRAGEKGAHQQMNGCCQETWVWCLLGKQGVERFGAGRQHEDVGV